MGALNELQSMGLHLSLHGELLRVEPKAAITNEARTLIRAQKEELIQALSSTATVRQQVATEAKAKELTRLVAVAAKVYAFTPTQRDEALQIALADPIAALDCFRAIAASAARSVLTCRV